MFHLFPMCRAVAAGVAVWAVARRTRSCSTGQTVSAKTSQKIAARPSACAMYAKTLSVAAIFVPENLCLILASRSS